MNTQILTSSTTLVENNVYIVRAGNCFKGGVAKRIGTRLAQLQTGNPQKVELIAYRSDEHAGSIERKIHAELHSLRLEGEWFRLSRPRFDSIVRDYGLTVAIDISNWQATAKEIEQEQEFKRFLSREQVQKPTGKVASNKGSDHFNVYLYKTTGRALRVLKIETGKSVQAMPEEAIADYLKKYEHYLPG